MGQQPQRIGSQIRPSLMMIPCALPATGARFTVGDGDIGDGAVAAAAGPDSASAATNTAPGAASTRSRRVRME